MSVLGIVVEYNPFHNGHLYHLNKAKEITGAKYTVAVMSGNFTQRGTPAVLDKYKRTLIALKNGVDMVVELPVLYATSSANYFARGAVSILKALGVDHMCFGAETNDLSLLEKASQENHVFKTYLKKSLNSGMSYPAAYQLALKQTGTAIDLSPNNILAIEYMRALKETESHIKPYAIARNQELKSATEINKSIARSIASTTKKRELDHIRSLLKSLPVDTFKSLETAIKQRKSIDLNNFSTILQYKLLTHANILNQFLDVDEGLENRLLKSAATKHFIDDIVNDIKTKRYTRLKIQRMITHILLDIKKQDIINYPTPPYVRILGFKYGSQELLKDIKELPLITNIKNAPYILGRSQYILEKEMFATDLYNLVSGGSIHPTTEKEIEYRIPLIIV